MVLFYCKSCNFPIDIGYLVSWRKRPYHHFCVADAVKKKIKKELKLELREWTSKETNAEEMKCLEESSKRTAK